MLLAILLVQSFLDLRAYRREKQTGLRNQLIIEVHFAFSLIAMLFAHLLQIVDKIFIGIVFGNAAVQVIHEGYAVDIGGVTFLYHISG